MLVFSMRTFVSCSPPFASMVCDEHRVLAVSSTDAQNALPPSFCSSDSFYRQVLCTQNLAIGFAPIPSFASVPESKLIQDTIERRSCRATTGRHNVNEVNGLSVGAQDWDSCSPARARAACSTQLAYRFCGLESCPDRSDDGMCAIGASLFFVPYERAEPPAGQFA